RWVAAGAAARPADPRQVPKRRRCSPALSRGPRPLGVLACAWLVVLVGELPRSSFLNEDELNSGVGGGRGRRCSLRLSGPDVEVVGDASSAVVKDRASSIKRNDDRGFICDIAQADALMRRLETGKIESHVQKRVAGQVRREAWVVRIRVGNRLRIEPVVL